MQDQFQLLTSLLKTKVGGHDTADIPLPTRSGHRAYVENVHM